ncbi:MAG: universal stress protein [Nitrospirae bacterium]|nr:universal stress protein [Nitrospirota bacterium]
MDRWPKKIILCVDNSELSNLSIDVAETLASEFSSEIVGVHGYNAFMHEGAFRIMEPTLPEQYQREELLARQRELHNKLINIGMEKISLSYLRPLQERFGTKGIAFKPKVKEGKNFVALIQMIEEEDADLIVLGNAGFNSNFRGFVGSVCLRILRRINQDFLVIKSAINFDEAPRIVVCLDGSLTSIGALERAIKIAERTRSELHLVYVFDSKLHKDVFARLKDAVLMKEGFRFNKKEQEKMHDEFIDIGLEKVGRMILDRAEKTVLSGNVASKVAAVATLGYGPIGEPSGRPMIIKKILKGHIYRSICEYAEEIDAGLICIGKTGRHYTDQIDLGSVCENVVRFAHCSVLISKHEGYRGWEL